MITFEYAARLQETMKVRFEAIHRLAQIQIQKQQQTTFNRKFTPFSIRDILEPKVNDSDVRCRFRFHDGSSNHDDGCRIAPAKPAVRKRQRHEREKHSTPGNIVRPWTRQREDKTVRVEDNSSDEEEISVVDDEPPAKSKRSPLDALMEMATKTFNPADNNAIDDKADGFSAALGKPSSAKKRRKSRTAFTNQQIYELEKRFLYQKYLTPADRDDIAASLRLTNAQVITWFQNRRAKLKRDMEELKNDITAMGSVYSSDSKCDDDSSVDGCALSPRSENGHADELDVSIRADNNTPVDT